MSATDAVAPPPDLGRLLALVERQAAQIDALLARTPAVDNRTNLDETMADMWARYFRTLPAMPWKKVAASTMKRFLAMHGSVRVGDFGPLHWETYRSDPEIRNHYSVTTRNIQLIRIKAMLNWAVATDQLIESPVRRVKRERGRPKRQTEISAVDESTILRGMSPLMRTIFVVAIDSAMRRDEVRTLEWTDIDLETGAVQLPAQRTKSKRARTVYLTARAIDLLKALPRYPGCPYVFANKHTRHPVSVNFIWYGFRKAVDRNGVKPASGDVSVRFHDARRTAAMRLVRLGAPIPAVQEILGHSDLKITSVYVHAQSRDVMNAHALLNKAQIAASQVVSS